MSGNDKVVTGGTLDHRRTWHVPCAAIRKIDGQTVYLAHVLALG